MRMTVYMIGMTALLAGCQSHTGVQHSYPIGIQCLKKCHTVKISSTQLTFKQRAALTRFAKGVKQPILVSPCAKNTSRENVSQITGYLKQHGYLVRVVRATMPYQSTQIACVNLVSGPLRIHPPKCKAYQLVANTGEASFGCASQQWLARSIVNPYDFLRGSGVQGTAP